MWDKVSGAAAYDVVVGSESVRTVNTSYVPIKTLPNSVQTWTVRAIGATNETSGWAQAQLSPGNVAGPQLLSPAGGAPLQQPDDPPLLAWEPVSGAVAYTVTIDADDDFVGATELRTRSSSLVVPNVLTAGDWYWKVAADLGNGISSASSDERRFDVLPLADPAMVGPQGNVEVQDVVLDWNPVVGAKYYEVQVARNNDFTNIIESRTGIQGTNYSPVVTYDNAQYFWRVRSIDVNEQSTPWSAARSVFTRTYPDAPALRHPASGSIVGAPLYLQWDPVPHASEYELQMGSNENFSNGTFKICRIAGTTYVPFEFAINPSAQYTSIRSNEACRPAVNQTTYWRVRPLDRPYSKPGDNPGVQGQYSPTRSFTYRPLNITGMQPTAGATVDVPTMSWNPMRGADTYTLQITGPSTSFSVTTAATSFTPSRRLAEGSYTWTIRGTTVDGQTSIIYPNSFVVSGSTPAVAGTPLTPLSGRATDPETPSAPNLTWVPLTTADHYRIYIGAAGQYTEDGQPVFYEPTFADYSYNNLDYPAFAETNPRYLRPGDYHWIVMAYDASNTPIAQGPLTTFSVSDINTVTGQSLAIDGSILVAGGGCTAHLTDGVNGPRCEGVPTTPVLSWDPVPGANLYMVYVSRDRSFTNLLEPTSSIPATSNTMYAPTLDNDAHTYPDVEGDRPLYWFIRPCRTVGECGPSPVSTSGLATNAFVKTSPAVDQLQSGDRSMSELNFSWRDYHLTNQATTWPSTGEKSTQSAMQYRIQIDTDTAFQAPFVDQQIVDQATYTAFDRIYPEGELYWRVQAIDSDNNGLTWSKAVAIDKSSTPVEIVSPAADGTVDGTAPLRWKAQAFLGSYDVEVYRGDDSNFSSGNRVISATRVKTNAYVTEAPLTPSSSAYRWRVRRRDATDNAGPWTTGRFFVRSRVPALLLPAPGASQPANAPTMSWEPTLGAASYQMSVVSSTGRSLAQVETVATSYAVPSSAPTGLYTWEVTALDNDRKIIGVARSTFTVDAGIKVVRPVEIQAPSGTGVGATVTSTAPLWDPSDATMTYQWLRGGTPIYGANEASYVLTATDFGAGISLRVTAKRSGFDDATSVSNIIGTTAGGALQPMVPPSLNGEPVPGSTLIASGGTWSQPGPTLKYQWLRTGTPIPGATSSFYTLTPEDAGKDVAVTVLASKLGFTDGSSTTPSVSVAKLVSTTTSTLSATRIKKGKTVKVGVTVAVQGVAAPSGTVKIQDGIKTLKTFTVDPFRKGVMTVKLSSKKLKAGRHKIKLVYVGNASTASSHAKVIRLIVFTKGRSGGKSRRGIVSSP
ncbi:Ig-like domain repeat protein [Nocardioides sp. P5_E3]